MHKGRHICVLHLNVLGFLLAKQVRVLVKAYSMNLPHTWRIRSNSLSEIPVMCTVDIVVVIKRQLEYPRYRLLPLNLRFLSISSFLR